jgi:hypothetical protein
LANQERHTFSSGTLEIIEKERDVFLFLLKFFEKLDLKLRLSGKIKTFFILEELKKQNFLPE